jgi:hypothetical protein
LRTIETLLKEWMATIIVKAIENGFSRNPAILQWSV